MDLKDKRYVKVSIIVPVYNCEDYISDSLNSLVAQTLKDIEIIVVNDGSKDKSKEIIDLYASRFSNIVAIHQHNKGVSAARNAGLEIAKGEYVGFLDADDWVEQDMYQKLYEIIKLYDCDMVISSFEEEIDGIKRTRAIGIPKDYIIDKKNIRKIIYPYLLERDDMNSVCNKLFSNKLIKGYNVQFTEGVILGEDALFNFKFLTYSHRIYYLDYVGYHYREVQGSATKNILLKDYFKMALQNYKENINESKLWGLKADYIKKLKAIKLLNSVVSYTYIYLKPNTEITFRHRYNYVKKMINNKEFREALRLGYNDTYFDKDRYEKFILMMIKHKCTFGIYLATTYSRLKQC